MKTWLTDWKHKRILKGLGPVEPGHLKTSMQFAERKQADAMPCMWQVSFCTLRWIQAGKALPQVGRSRLGGIR